MKIAIEKARELLETIALLIIGIFEIRILNTDRGTVSGYFDNPEAAIREIEPYMGVNNIYVTMNPPDPALLSQSENKLTAFSARTTRDGDIIMMERLLVDIDPMRPAGTAATDQQKKAAEVLAATIRKRLHEDFGFSNPIIADSGNGYHLVYRVQLKNTRENVELLKKLLRALHFLYSNDAAQVDITTYNPARIVKLWGTTSCKGDESDPERPRRDSKVLKVPKEIVTVPLEAIQRVIAKLPTTDAAPSGAKKQSAKSIDAEKWLVDNGIEASYVKDDGDGGKIYVLSACPWRNHTQTDRGAYVMQFKNGALAAGCHHASCAGQDWRTLREKFEPQASEAKGGDDETQFDIIMQIADKNKIYLFYDQKEEPNAIVPVVNHTETYNIDSERLKQWFAYKFYRETKRAFTADAWTQAKGALSGIALYEGDEARIHTRCAGHDNILYYDLNNKDRQVVKVTADGWEIISDCDVLFYRNKTMAAQVIPIGDSSGIVLLDKHHRFKNEDDRILHIISLITKLLPHISHPIDVVYGSHGGGKTTTLRKDKSIVDPDKCDILTMPKKRENLIILLDKHYYICLDNLSGISVEMSDLLCMAATGGTAIIRKLYTNDGEIIFEFKQPVSVCGINVVATRADLLDRAILLELDRLSPSELKTESKLWTEWNADKPAIMGAIFSIISKAMRIFPTLDLEVLGRMADFTTWGFAIAEAAGIGGQRFLDAYMNNRNRANDEAIESHPVACAVLKFMADKVEWVGNATTLLSEFNTNAMRWQIDTKSFLWPSDPNVLSRRINEVKTNLEQRGLRIDSQAGGARLISIIDTRFYPPKQLQIPQTPQSNDSDEGNNCDNGGNISDNKVPPRAVSMPNELAEDDNKNYSKDDENYVLPF